MRFSALRDDKKNSTTAESQCECWKVKTLSGAITSHQTPALPSVSMRYLSFPICKVDPWEQLVRLLWRARELNSHEKHSELPVGRKVSANASRCRCHIRMCLVSAWLLRSVHVAATVIITYYHPQVCFPMNSPGNEACGDFPGKWEEKGSIWEAVARRGRDMSGAVLPRWDSPKCC